MASFPARDVFRGFEPRAEGQSWEEWVTRTLSRLDPGISSLYVPQKVDYSFTAHVGLWPFDSTLANQWSQAINHVGSTAGFSITAEPLTAGSEYQIWYDTLAADLTVVVDYPTPPVAAPFTSDAINSTSINPMQLVDVDRTTRVRLMLLEFYGSGTNSVFDTDRQPSGVIPSDLFHYFNPVSATMLSAQGGKCHSALRGWFPRQFTSPFQDPMRPDGAIGVGQVYSTTASNPVVGGRSSGTNPTERDYVLSNGGPSPWEFDCIWETVIELPQGPMSANVLPTVSDLLPRYAVQRPQIRRYYQRLNIPIKRTVRYNGMSETGAPTGLYYPERRFYLVAFMDYGCMLDAQPAGSGPQITATAGTGSFPAYNAPPRILMELEGQLTFLRYTDILGSGGSGTDEPDEIRTALEQNDADEALVGRRARKGPRDAQVSLVSTGKRQREDYVLYGHMALSDAPPKRRR